MEALKARDAHRTLWSNAWRQFRRHRLAMAGLSVFTFFVVACAAGPYVYRTPADAIDFARSNEGPGFEHPLGTNDRGEDMLARVLYGGRVSLAVGIVAMFLGLVIGTAIGAIAGYFGGIIDTLLMRLTELLISLPQLPLLLLIVYFFRDSLRDRIGIYAGTFLVMVCVLGGLQWMPVATARSSGLSIHQDEGIHRGCALHWRAAAADDREPHAAECCQRDYRFGVSGSRGSHSGGIHPFFSGARLSAGLSDMGTALV